MKTASTNPKKVMKWLDTMPNLRELCAAYPEDWAVVEGELAKALEHQAPDQLKTKLLQSLAIGAPLKTVARRNIGNRRSKKTVNSQLIRSRMIYLAIRNFELISVSGVNEGKVRFNKLNGDIVRKLLFSDGLERKTVSLFWFRLMWPLVWQKKMLMPLAESNGIYCFYSRALVMALAEIVGSRRCLEIAAGDGTLTRFLNQQGVRITATDNYSWNHVVKFNDLVENCGAKEALRKYDPKVVICSWPPANNNFERYVFRTRAVETYVVIGSRYQAATGNWSDYYNQSAFELAVNEELGQLVLPPELDSAVYVFQRK